MRTDCKRDNAQIICPNATMLGFGIRHCKRGFWVHFKDENDRERVGRAIGRVTCEGKVYIEVATAAENFSSAFIRWADPAKVLEIRRSPPRHVFNFFADTDGWQQDAIFRALEYGVSDLHDQMNANEESTS